MSNEESPAKAPLRVITTTAGRDLQQVNTGSISAEQVIFNQGAPALPLPLPSIGIRSYTRAAEKLAHETDDIIDVTQHFDGQRPKTPRSCELAAEKIIEFFRDPRLVSDLRKREHALYLECVMSLTFTAGYEASRNSGMQLFPIQKSDKLEVWRPTASVRKIAGRWHATSHPREASARDIAVGISVPNSVMRDVTSYLDTPGAPPVQALIELQPCLPGTREPSVGPSSIVDADHAYQLASELKVEFDRRRPHGGCVHVFTNGPAALMFFLGQLREALGCIQLYDFLWDTRTYYPSLRFDAGRLIPAAT